MIARRRASMLVCSPMRLRLDSQAATVYIPLKLRGQRVLQRLDVLAKKLDRSVNYLVVQAIMEFLDREERQA